MLEAAFDQRRRSLSGLPQQTPPRGVRDNETLKMEINMNVLEATAQPQLGDTAFYRAAPHKPGSK